MLSLKIELSGKNRMAFFRIDIGRNDNQVDSEEHQVQNELTACTEHIGLPDTATLKLIEDEWVNAGIIA